MFWHHDNRRPGMLCHNVKAVLNYQNKLKFMSLMFIIHCTKRRFCFAPQIVILTIHQIKLAALRFSLFYSCSSVKSVRNVRMKKEKLFALSSFSLSRTSFILNNWGIKVWKIKKLDFQLEQELTDIIININRLAFGKIKQNQPNHCSFFAHTFLFSTCLFIFFLVV